MPLLESTYKPRFPFTNTHFNTLFRTFFTYESVSYVRERLELSDGDFMDLDFSRVGSKSIVIALHGLEGSSNSKYIIAITNQLNKNNFDVAAVNFRGCSGEVNRVLSSYHSGRTEDLNAVIQHIKNTNKYKNIILLGYSLGGNMTLKYLGEQAQNISKEISCAIAVSVPCDLASSSKALAKSSNIIYMKRFLRTLKSKTLLKLNDFPDSFIDKKAILNAKDFYDYDSLFTAPANGFNSAEDYWEKSSSKPFLKNITVPTLLITGQDDTFLLEECFPYEIAKHHDYLFFEAPKFGGHVGFNQYLIGKKGYWLESRIVSFIKEKLREK